MFNTNRQHPSTGSFHGTSVRSTADGGVVRRKPGNQSASTSQGYRECTVCGRKNHRVSDCFYKNATCVRCGKKGHLKYVCKFNFKNKNSKNVNIIESNVQNLNEIDSDSDTYLKLCHTNINSINKYSNPILIQVKIESINLSMEVDTGSAVSLISNDLYKKYFSHIPILFSDIKLSSFTGNNIKVIGYIKVNVIYNNNKAYLELFIVPSNVPTLVGRTWLSRLKINIYNDVLVKSILHCDNNLEINSLTKEFKEIFDLRFPGKFNLFKAVLHLKPNVTPVF